MELGANKLSVFLRLTMNTLKRDTNPPLKEYANVSRFSSSALKFRLDGVVSIFLNLFFVCVSKLDKVQIL